MEVGKGKKGKSGKASIVNIMLASWATLKR